MNFEARVEALDRHSHLTSTFVGYLRQYQSKREIIAQMSRDMTLLERKMVTTRDLLRIEDQKIRENLNYLLPPSFQEGELISAAVAHAHATEEADEIVEAVSESDDDNDADEVDSVDADDEITLTPHFMPTTATSVPTSTGGVRASFPSTSNESIDIGNETLIIGCVARVESHREFGRVEMKIKRRTYDRPVPCSLCEEVFYNHYKCSNARCTGRICSTCFSKLDTPAPLDRELCPFCRAVYDLDSVANSVN